MENHYNTLNVQVGDSLETIKIAYRRLAMKWHPDKNLYNPLAENKFKLILRAYQVLSGPDRTKYDQEYAKVFNNNLHKQKVEPFKHTNFNYMKNDEGFSRTSNKFNSSSNSNTKSHTNSTHNSNMYENNKNSGLNSELKHIKVKISLNFWDAILGCNQTYQIKDPFSKEFFSIDIKFPPGVSDNDILQVSTDNRVIALHITTLNDDYFTRQELDIHSYFDIPFSIATSGGSIDYPYWSGNLKLQIPMGFQHGQTLKIEGKGINKKGRKGDLYLKGKIIIPMNITTSQKDLIEKFQKIEDDKGKPSPLLKFLQELWKKK